MKLSDTQLLILSSASQQADHSAILPANIKGSAAKKVVDGLSKEKLVQELRAKDDMPIWRRGDDNRAYSLRITKAGLKAIGVDEVAQCPDGHGTTDADLVAAAAVSTEVKRSEGPVGAKRSGAKKSAAASAKPTKTSSALKADSKQDEILTLLQRPKGATLDVLVKETQWQKHSVRGFLAGTVRKKLKFPLLSKKIDGVRTYRIGTGKSAKSKKTLGQERLDRMSRKAFDDAALQAEIGRLPALSLLELRNCWKALFGHPAPKSLRRNFLARAVAYQMQVEVYGGLSVATKRRLREIANAVRSGDSNGILGATRIRPGTQMIRQWQNTTHTVTALAEGFEWNGRTYKSLSAVANAITGTNWNGFAFFGIKRAPAGNKNASGPRRLSIHASPDVRAPPLSELKSTRGGQNA
jgi:hypothetical protein